MIKGIVLDIDGVIVGSKEGVNFPHPSKKIRSILRNVHEKGIPISFITAKPSFAAAENIKLVGIDNPHIADAGATIFNPLHNQIIHRTLLETHILHKLLEALPKQTQIMLFGSKGYYAKKNQHNEFLERYEKIVEQSPQTVDSFNTVITEEKIVKLNIVAFSNEEKKVLTDIATSLQDFLSFNWATHPFIEPILVMVITAKGVSKRSGVEYLAKYLGISPNEMLGVGDSIQDWDFIEVCGYKAIMKNAAENVKERIDRNDSTQVIGGDVDEDGLIEVLRHFRII